MRRNLAVAAVIPLLAALLGACGGQDAAAPQPTPTVATLEEWQLANAACMREHGIEMSDPSGGGVTISGGEDMAAVTAASEACRAKLGPPPGGTGDDPASDEERLARQLELARCLREHGVQVEDPAAGQAMGLPRDVPADVQEACGFGGAQPAVPGGDN